MDINEIKRQLHKKENEILAVTGDKTRAQDDLNHVTLIQQRKIKAEGEVTIIDAELVRLQGEKKELTARKEQVVSTPIEGIVHGEIKKMEIERYESAISKIDEQIALLERKKSHKQAKVSILTHSLEEESKYITDRIALLDGKLSKLYSERDRLQKELLEIQQSEMAD